MVHVVIPSAHRLSWGASGRMGNGINLRKRMMLQVTNHGQSRQLLYQTCASFNTREWSPSYDVLLVPREWVVARCEFFFYAPIRTVGRTDEELLNQKCLVWKLHLVCSPYINGNNTLHQCWLVRMRTNSCVQRGPFNFTRWHDVSGNCSEKLVECVPTANVYGMLCVVVLVECKRILGW